MENFTKEREDLESQKFKAYINSRAHIDSALFFCTELRLAYRAAQRLIPDYDLGIAIAKGGLFLGYVFETSGLPTQVVHMKRRKSWVTWNPINIIKKEDIKGKRILFLENDFVTGRTLEKAARKLNRFQPNCLDALFIHRSTYLSILQYKQLKKDHKMPHLFDIVTNPFNILGKNSSSRDSLYVEHLDNQNLRETPEGIEFDFDEDYIPYNLGDYFERFSFDKDYSTYKLFDYYTRFERPIKLLNEDQVTVDLKLLPKPEGIEKIITLSDFYE